MKNISSWAVAIFVIAISFFAVSKPILADTYQIFNLGTDAAVFFYGMDDSGAVVLQSDSHNISAPCIAGLTCYHTFDYGVSSAFSNTAPSLTFDNGTPCTPAVPAGGSVIRGVCNNGLDAFTGRIASGQVLPDVYVGSFPNIAFLAGGGEGPVFMNSLGDITFEDNFSENWFYALDTTSHVPEPGSIFLVGTGVFAAFGAMRRRLSMKA